MKKYFVLYMASAASFKKMMDQMKDQTPAQRKAGMDSWNAWMKDNKKALTDGGKPLGKTKRVTKDKISDARNEVGGYSIVEAASHDEAAEIMRSNPHLDMSPDAWIEVMEIMEM